MNMENNLKKPVTYDIKKEVRFQNKKRKLEALLELFQEEEKSPIVERKKNGNSLQEDYKALKVELKKFMKKPEVDPSFHLTEIGLKSMIPLKSDKLPKKIKPLFVQDVYQLLLRSVIGHMSLHTVQWANLDHPQNINRTVFIVIEGIPKQDFIKNRSSLTNTVSMFSNIVEIVSPNLPFPQELTTLHKITHFHIDNDETYSTMFPSKKEVKVEAPQDLQQPSRLHLLLSPIQLVMENYPLPKSVFEFSKSENYTFSKEAYAPVTTASPLFAVDCEMCRTTSASNDLTRIAVVDERHEVRYQSLVKPKSKIVDYMTRYSGITKKMLQGVKTTLEDVQKDLRSLLPPDAILCGQSLNCDLHALKMIHPYVIDTSIIFNGSGVRAKKDSLKYLTKVHLNEDIQNNKKSGHNPVEDALATMKLVQLKLNNSVHFGDACFGNEEERKEEPNSNAAEAAGKPEEDSFFAQTFKYNKKTCLIGTEQTLNLYGNLVSDSVLKKPKANVKKILKATLKHIGNHDLTISHFDMGSSEESDLLKELDDSLQQVFDCCPDRTMFMVFASGVDKSKFEDIKRGLFMGTIKNIKIAT